MFDGNLMLWVNRPIVDTIHPYNNKFVTGEMKHNDSPACLPVQRSKDCESVKEKAGSDLMTVPLGIYKEQLSKTTSQLADFWASVSQQRANSQLLFTCTQYSVKRRDELQSNKCSG